MANHERLSGLRNKDSVILLGLPEKKKNACVFLSPVKLKMNLGWGPSYLEFKDAGATTSRITGNGANAIRLSGPTPTDQVQLQNIRNPTALTDASNKSYVDFKVNQGLSGVVKTDASVQQKDGQFTFANLADSTTPSDGSLVVSGGLGVGLNMNVGGQVSADSYLVTSDAALKSQIESLDSPLERLRGVNSYSYKLNGSERVRVGILAQELEENGLGDLVEELSDHKAVDYNGLVGVLLGAIKELDKEVKLLREKLG